MIITKNEFMGEVGDFSITNEGKEVRTYTHKRQVGSEQDGNIRTVASSLTYYAGMPFSNDPAALLKKMSIERLKTVAPHCLWDVTLFYTTECPPAQAQSEDPTQQRVNVEWQTSSHTLYIVKDRNGVPILNAAKQPFDGGVPVTVELPTLVYERNEVSFNGALMEAYANSLNSDYYSGAEPETLKLKISGKLKREGIYEYWAVRYEMAKFALGWQPQPMNAGLYQLISSKLVRCKDRDKQDVTSPVPLDLAGLQIPIASLPSAANFIKVDFFNKLPYASFGLDQV